MSDPESYILEATILEKGYSLYERIVIKEVVIAFNHCVLYAVPFDKQRTLCFQEIVLVTTYFLLSEGKGF